MHFRTTTAIVLVASLVGSAAIAKALPVDETSSNFGKSAFDTTTGTVSSFDRERGVTSATTEVAPLSTTQTTVPTLAGVAPVKMQTDVASVPTAPTSVKPVKPVEEISTPSTEMVYIKTTRPEAVKDDSTASDSWQEATPTLPEPATGQYVATDDPNVSYVAIPAKVLDNAVEAQGFAEVNGGQVIYAAPTAGAADIAASNVAANGPAIDYIEVQAGRALQ